MVDRDGELVVVDERKETVAQLAARRPDLLHDDDTVVILSVPSDFTNYGGLLSRVVADGWPRDERGHELAVEGRVPVGPYEPTERVSEHLAKDIERLRAPKS